MNFFEIAGFDLPERFARRPTGDNFVPLRRITSRQDADDLSISGAKFIDEQLGDVPGSVYSKFRMLLFEIGHNIVAHSLDSQTGVGMAQAWKGQRSTFQMAFADLGVGIRSSLAANVPEFRDLDDDLEAIGYAVQDRVTSGHPSKHMGRGLFELVDFSKRTSGSVSIISGTGCWRNRGGAQMNTRLNFSFPGTLVCFDGICGG